jgi:hypothetical protein
MGGYIGVVALNVCILSSPLPPLAFSTGMETAEQQIASSTVPLFCASLRYPAAEPGLHSPKPLPALVQPLTRSFHGRPLIQTSTPRKRIVGDYFKWHMCVQLLALSSSKLKDILQHAKMDLPLIYQTPRLSTHWVGVHGEMVTCFSTVLHLSAPCNHPYSDSVVSPLSIIWITSYMRHSIVASAGLPLHLGQTRKRISK